MSLSDPTAAIEIGTTYTVVAIGEPRPDGNVRIAAVREIPSNGVRKSQIHDIGQARYSIESVLKQLSSRDGYSICRACLVMSGAHMQTLPVNAQLQIEHGSVHEEDVNQIVDLSYDPNLSSDRTPLEISQIEFSLDGMQHIASPKGMHGRLLKLHSLCIHGSSQRIMDARTVASSAKLEIGETDVFFSGTCASAAVLSPQMKREGALVIDLGGGTTSYSVWVSGALVQAGVIAVGGDHVTHDIQHAFSLTTRQAEELKHKSASCLVEAEDAAHRITVKSTTPGLDGASVPLRALNTVTNARMQELFTIIRTKLDDENHLHGLNAGVVLTGGGALLKNAAPLASSVFGCAAAVGTIVPQIEGLDELELDRPPVAYASVAGLLLQARATTSSHSMMDSIKNFFGRAFGK